MPEQTTGPLPFYATPRFRTITLSIIGVVLIIEAYIAIFVRKNDIMCHIAVGEAFLSGDPYKYGQDIYPVGRTMIDSLLAIAPYYVTRAVAYTLAVLGLFACYWMWRRMAENSSDVKPEFTNAAAITASFVLFIYLIRDLDECGLQTFVYVMLTFAGYMLLRGKQHWAGLTLATAAMYKVTPALFLPFFLFKRQWRAAAWMAGFLALWFLAPMPFLGVQKTLDCHAQWWARSTKIASAREAYPSQLELEEPKFYNQSLQASIARFVITVPPDHPLYLDHPAFMQFGDLDPETAYYVVRGIMVVFALIIALRYWPQWRSSGTGQPDLAREWAGLCILAAILSPVCWKQHLILAWPALFLVFRAMLADRQIFRTRIVPVLITTGLILLTRRFLVGRDLAYVLMSYKLDFLAVFLILGMVLTLPRHRQKMALEKDLDHTESEQLISQAA